MHQGCLPVQIKRQGVSAARQEGPHSSEMMFGDGDVQRRQAPAVRMVHGGPCADQNLDCAKIAVSCGDVKGSVAFGGGLHPGDGNGSVWLPS
jgi:hypothetical protein